MYLNNTGEIMESHSKAISDKVGPYYSENTGNDELCDHIS